MNRNEWIALRQSGYSFQEALSCMMEGYVLQARGAWTTWPKARDLMTIGTRMRLPKTGIEVQMLHNGHMFNTERCFWSHDSQYVTTRQGSTQTMVVNDREGREVRRFDMPDHVLLSTVWRHHALNVLYWAEDHQLKGIDFLTGETYESQIVDYKIGEYYQKGKKHSRIAGGDFNDSSYNGIALLTKDGKYGQAVVVQIADYGLTFKELSTQDWSLPEGTDAATASWDGSHVVIGGQKDSPFNRIEAWDHDGKSLLLLHNARGHSDTFPFQLKDGTWVHAIGTKLNQRTAGELDMDTGDNIIILYRKTASGDWEIFDRIEVVDGKAAWAPNLAGQYSHPGHPTCKLLLKHFQYDKTHYRKSPSDPYLGCTVDIALWEGDPVPRVWYVNGSGGADVSKQAEGCISPDGTRAVIKFNDDGTGKGRLAMVFIEERLHIDLRTLLFGGYYTEANEHELLTAIETGVIIPPTDDPLDPILPEPAPITDPISETKLEAIYTLIKDMKSKIDYLYALLSGIGDLLSNKK